VKGLSYWYHTRNRKYRKTIIALAVAVIMVTVGLVGYTLLWPRKVEVRYGTIVRDPVDGHVWEDNTKTARVDADKARKYTVQYVDKLSPEHQNQEVKQENQKAQEAAEAESAQVVQPATPVITEEQLSNMRAAQQSVDSVAGSVIEGLRMLDGFVEAKNQMISYRNQIAATPVGAQVEPLKQRLLAIFDKYIQASDLYIQAIVTADLSKATQAEALVSEANSTVEKFLPVAQKLKETIDEFINILRRIFPSGS
jgi:hypothetical protein